MTPAGIEAEVCADEAPKKRGFLSRLFMGVCSTDGCGNAPFLCGVCLPCTLVNLERVTDSACDTEIKEEEGKPLTTQVGGDHYKHLAIQPAEYCQRNRLPYCESAVVRYVTRHRRKNGRQDIEKAIHCLQILLAMEYPDSEKPGIKP